MTTTPITSLLLCFSSLALLFSIAAAQDRAPHGLAYENPMAFPPQAFSFFHPKTQDPDTKNPCSASENCSSPLPVAAQVQSTKAQESKYPTTPHHGSRIGAGGIVGIVAVVTFVVTLAMAAYFVVIKRRANMNRAQAKSFQPNA